MRVVVQRVSHAEVSVEKKMISTIEHGYVLLVGMHVHDTETVVDKMAKKIHALRVFEDTEGKMNLSLGQVNGSILAISQFTLYGDTKGNNRPSFIEAARPEQAEKLYDLFCDKLAENHEVKKGVFGAHMEVSLLNNGPVTIIIEMN